MATRAAVVVVFIPFVVVEEVASAPAVAVVAIVVAIIVAGVAKSAAVAVAFAVPVPVPVAPVAEAPTVAVVVVVAPISAIAAVVAVVDLLKGLPHAVCNLLFHLEQLISDLLQNAVVHRLASLSLLKAISQVSQTFRGSFYGHFFRIHAVSPILCRVVAFFAQAFRRPEMRF